MSHALKTHLQNNKKLKHVYLNDKGEWQFHKRAGFDTVKTRAEILDTEYDPDGTEDYASQEEIKSKTKVGRLIPLGTTPKKGAPAADNDDELDNAIEAQIKAEAERDELKKQADELAKEKAAMQKEIEALKKAKAEAEKKQTKEAK